MTVVGKPSLPRRRQLPPSPRSAGSRSVTAFSVLAASALALPLATAPAPALAQDGEEILGVGPADLDINLSAFGETTLTDSAGGAGGGGGGGDSDSGDVIATVGGTATAIANGARTNIAATYTASYDQYLSQSSRSGYRQTLLGAGTYEAIEDNLFFDVNASMATRFTGIGAASATERAGVGNQTQTFSWSLGPTWRQRVGGSFANMFASYRLQGTTFFEASSGDVGDQNRPDDGIIHNAAIGLSSGRDFARLRWNLLGSWQQQTGGSGEDGESGERSVEASTEYRINRQWGLLGSVGYDDVQLADQSEGVTSESDLSGPFWTAGLRFNPSERTDMRAEYGQRYGEPYYRGQVNWRPTQLTSISASYTTEVVTLQESLLTGIEEQCLADFLSAEAIDAACLSDLLASGVVSRDGVDPSAPFSLVDATTRTETLRIGASRQHERTTYTVSGTLTQREFTSTGEEDTTLGINGSVAQQLTPETSGMVSVSYTTSDNTVTGSETTGLTTSDGTTSLRGSLSVSHQFADDLQGSVSYSHLRRDQEADTGSSSENALVARIMVTF